jgi:uncharacterized delta-60 repeat protein
MTKLRFCLPLLLAGLLQAGTGFAALTLDGAFGTNGTATIETSGGLDKARGVVEQPADGKVLLVGVSPRFTDPDTVNYVVLARFSPAGVPDAGFGTDGVLAFLPGPTPQDGGGGDGRAVLIQPADDQILVAGNWDLNDGSGSQVFLARFDSAGVADPVFGTAGIVFPTLPGLTHTTAEALVLQADGSIVVAGSAGPAGSRQGLIFRVTSAGELDPTFATGGVFVLDNPSLPGTDFGFTDLKPAAGDSLVASGGGGDLVLVKISGAGVADAGFGTDGVAAFNVRSYTTAEGTGPSFDTANAIAVLSDGRILVAGATGATETGPNTDAVLARVTSAGALDTTYGSGGYASLADPTAVDAAAAIGVRPSGDAVIAGIGFFPTQVGPDGRALSLLSGSFTAGTADLDVLGDGSIIGGGFVLEPEVQGEPPASELAVYHLNATDLADGTDRVPDPIAFTPQVDLELGATVTSNTVTITGIAAPAAISVSAGSSYAIGCTSAFVSTAGTINDGQTVCVRTTVGSVDETVKNAVLTVGGVRGVFAAVTGDSTPDPFTFTDQEPVPSDTEVESAPITLTGLNITAAVSVTGGEYSVGCTGTWTAAAGSAVSGDQICVRHTSSPYPGALTSTTLSVGAGAGTSDSFDSTTEGTPDTSPDPFSFDDQTDVEPSTLITSAAVTITGITNPTTVLVSGIGGSYSIGCSDTFTTATRTILDGETVCVRHTSAAVGLTATETTLVVGDQQAVFTSTTREADTTPDAFSFDDQVDVEPSTIIISAPITISGIDALTPISTIGGDYSLGCTSNFSFTAGTVSNGQTVCVRHTSSSAGDTAVTTTLTVGGVSDVFTSTTRTVVSTPDPFSFVDQTGVPLATVITSDAVQLSGYNVNVSVSVTGGTYSVGCTSSFTSASRNDLPPDARICVRHTSASLGDALTETVLTVGGVSDTFSSTTIPGDASPAPFPFVDQTGVDLNETITSAPVTISGTTIAAPITITGGEYSIGCNSTYTTAAGSIAPGKTLCVRHQSSFDGSTDTNTTVTIGNVSGVFTSTTKAGDQTPDDFSFDTQTDVALSTIIVSSPVTISGVDSPVKLFVSGPSGSVGFARDCKEPYESPSFNGSIFENGDTLCVLIFSSDTDLTSLVATVNLGGNAPDSQKSATFTVTTGETVPDAFTFTDEVGVLLGATVYALPITITGITAPSKVVVSNGQWQLNCTGGYTSNEGVVSNGETICVRHIAAGTLATLTSTELTVGGISDTFTSTTVIDKPLPGGSAVDPLSLLLLAPLLGYRRRRQALMRAAV